MKKILILTATVTSGFWIASCTNGSKPGRTYMPDMQYSRAYETYAELDSAKFTTNEADRGKDKIFYNSLPVAGTVAIGDMPAYPYKNDSAGYALSASVTSPLPPLNDVEMKEAERLYLVNCGICHGAKLDGQGPLYNDGNGPYTSAPKNFLADDMKKLPEGTMFHSVTYGLRAMGSYASQLSTRQRWMIIHYIKSKQGGTAAPAGTTAAK